MLSSGATEQSFSEERGIGANLMSDPSRDKSFSEASTLKPDKTEREG
jgi:hypothetical protein